jgi:predicted dehydrogenase
MITRRNFIKSGSLLVAGTALPNIMKGTNFGISANDTINVALIGCRNMGWGDLNDFLIDKQVKCVALCDVDENMMQSRKEELVEKYNMSPKLYTDYRKLLDDKDIDAVIIATPDHWHCLQFIDSCAAGKDVYIEKPIANSIAECNAMVAAAKKYKRVVQVGQQQRSSGHWQEMVKYLNSGQLGKIGRVNVWANFNYAAIRQRKPDTDPPKGFDYEMWLGPAPSRPFNEQRVYGLWRMFWNYGGGLMTDWGVHLLDMGLWGMNQNSLPDEVQAVGGNFLYPDGVQETFDTLSVSYKFPGFIMTWENNAGVETGPYGRNYGVLFRGTNGTLVANRDNWEVYPEGEKIPAVTVKADFKDHKIHVENFLDSMRKRVMQTACTIENGSMCAKYAHLGNIAARAGNATLHYDDTKRTFLESAANKYIKPEYRNPWVFPDL